MSNQKKPTMLELFSGSKTVSGVFENRGWFAISVDNNPKLNPSICCDILDITRDMLPEIVSFIWGSPVCETFSRAALSSHFRKEILKYRQYRYTPITEKGHNSLLMLNKTIEIINWFPAARFVIENPVGLIQHFSSMKNLGHFRYFVNYFDFGFEYSKETYMFCNMFLPLSTKKYKVVAPGLRTVNSKFERSKVPALLAHYVCTYVADTLNIK